MYMDLDSSPITLSLTVNGGSATTYSSDSLSQNYNNLIHDRTYGFVASDAQSGTVGIQFTFNFGQNPTFCGQTTAGTFTDSNGKGLFKYEPPTGFLALCDDNLPTPAVADPGDHFKTVLYTGTGSSRAVTGVGFKPDFVWIKNRDFSLNTSISEVPRNGAMGKNVAPFQLSQIASASNTLTVLPVHTFNKSNIGHHLRSQSCLSH